MPGQPHRQFLLGCARAAGGREAFLVTLADAGQVPPAVLGLLQARVAPWPDTGSLVVARLGLMSAWSAKARGIMQAAGLDAVRQVERGLLHAGAEPPHDPLLETVLTGTAIRDWGSGTAPRATAAAVADALQAGLDPAAADRLAQALAGLGRPATPAERAIAILAGSEHCRHVTFRRHWAGTADPTALFTTLGVNADGMADGPPANAAVFPAGGERRFLPSGADGQWHTAAAGIPLHTTFKAETHNHPTGIAPWPGAATGVGGEIRDEAAVGGGGASHAGAAGYIVARTAGPPGFADPQRIMREAPLGAADYANEYGRPTLTGFCRVHEHTMGGRTFGFHKPVMFAAGIGEALRPGAGGLPPRPGDLVVVLGGPAMLVGVGGGAAASGAPDSIDSAAVQRADAEMQRRVQETIDRCRLTPSNPLRAVHDVGAGGLGTALAELVLPAGAAIDLDAVPAAQAGMNPVQLLINEAQERFVALVDPADLDVLVSACTAEACPQAVVGTITGTGRLVVTAHGTTVVDMPGAAIFGPEPGPATLAWPPAREVTVTDPVGIDLAAACVAVLTHPNVADKSCLVTIADRGVGGLVARDQLVGPWQQAVADCGVTRLDHRTCQGRVLACGERPAIAMVDPAAAARVAVAEALTNIAGAAGPELGAVRLALNWMGNNVDASGRGELVAAVRGACEPFLRELGIPVVTGKDSLSMRASWTGPAGQRHASAAPTTCVATACAHCADVRATLTPQLSDRADTILMRLSTAQAQPLGLGVLATACELAGDDVPDVTAAALAAWWRTLAAIRRQGLALACHDISDGGMLATVAEMCFAANRGATLVLDSLCQPAMGLDADGCEQSADTTAAGGRARMARELFSEQPGAVIEVARADAAAVLEIAGRAGLPGGAQTIGWPAPARRIKVLRNAAAVVDLALDDLHAAWRGHGSAVRAARDAPAAAAEEAVVTLANDPGLHATPHVPLRVRPSTRRPPATVLRDRGTNGHVEMAAALDAAGFAVRSVTLVEAQAMPTTLDCALLVLPGGFSHADVLGAGAGMAATLRGQPALRARLAEHLHRGRLVLGVCNGCQVLARLGEDLGHAMPTFAPNRSGRFECRLALVEVLPCASPFLAPLAGVRLPVPVAGGEGRAGLPSPAAGMVAVQPALRFVTTAGELARLHPANPTGAADGLCGFCTPDGKVTLVLPHPERAVDPAQLSWCPPAWRGGPTPWADCFINARNHLA